VSISKKPCNIKDLKELVNNLSDRDTLIKNHLCCIKEILEDKTIKTDATRIRRIKKVLKDG
jgi:hypothetical protein|tara:strand:+ start:186 stop:368 length:183 start_codon:yes stop_codon:yes gene_type:complete